MVWILFFLSVLVSFFATRLSIILSLRRGVLDGPNARSLHSVPVPRIGGVGILTSFYLTITALVVLSKMGISEYPPFPKSIVVILVAGAGMALGGLVDDVYHVNPGTKYLLQLGLATLVVVLSFRIESVTVPFRNSVKLRICAAPLTILWLTGFSNIYNFMDGINGLAAGTGVIYGAFFFLFAWLQGNLGLASVAVLLSGSCLGFLFHNFPQARTFMGDNGSLFLGMVFALLVVRLAQQSSNPASLVALLLVCSVYLYDSSFTLLRRLIRGENIFHAHRSHLYQRLALSGVSHVKITMLYLILHSLMGILALSYIRSSDVLRLWILASASVVLLGFTLGVYRFENRFARRSKDSSDGSAPSSQSSCATQTKSNE